MEESNEKLPFLDILLYKEGKDLHTDIFYKETDAHEYLLFKSCRSKLMKQIIPYSLARVCSIVSEPEIRGKRLHEL